jgi:hypothetical protein
MPNCLETDHDRLLSHLYVFTTLDPPILFYIFSALETASSNNLRNQPLNSCIFTFFHFPDLPIQIIQRHKVIADWVLQHVETVKINDVSDELAAIFFKHRPTNMDRRENLIKFPVFLQGIKIER